MSEYINKADLYKEIATREESVRDTYLKFSSFNIPSNDSVFIRYQSQLNELTNLKHLIANFQAVDFGNDLDRLNELVKADDEGRVKIYDKGYKCPECGSYTYYAKRKGGFECVKCGCHINYWGIDAYASVLMDLEEERIKESEIDEESKREKIDTMKKTIKEYSDNLKERHKILNDLLKQFDEDEIK